MTASHYLTFLLALALPLGAFAQEIPSPPSGPPPTLPPTAPPSSPPPSLPPTTSDSESVRSAPGPRPRGPGSSSSEGNGAIISGENVSLQFPNNPVSDLLGIYERLTGKTLIKDTGIFEGPTLSLVTPREVPFDEAIRLIEASLLTNGYALSPGPTEDSIKVLPTRVQGVSQVSFSDGITIYKDPLQIPQGDLIAGYFMPLENLDPEAAAELFSNHVGLNLYGRITPVATPPGVLITESANIIRQLIDIQSVLDSPDQLDSIITEFIDLEYADANTVAQIIQATLDARREVEAGNPRTFSGQQDGRATNPKDGRGPTGQPQQQGQQQQQQQGNKTLSFQQNNNIGQSTEIPPAQLVADARLNRIMIIAGADDFAYISSLIQKFDQPNEDDEPYERALQFAYAEEILPVLADILNDADVNSTQLPGGGRLTNANNQLQSSNRTESLTGLTGNNSRQITTSNTDSVGGSDSLEQAEEDFAPVSLSVGKTRIIADPRANSIIAFGTDSAINKIDTLIDTLDRRQPQVYLSTVIGQLTLGDGIDFGLDYVQSLAPGGLNNGGFTSSNLNSPLGIPGSIADLRTNALNPFGPGGGFNVYGQLGNSVGVFLNALENDSKFKVLSRPTMYAANNKKAVITSGQRIPVPTSSVTNTSSDNGNVTTNIAYEDVVLKLEIIPLINRDGDVTLTIAQVNDSVIGEQTIDNNTIPIIGTEELTTTVTVADGKTIVIGGLITEEENETVKGIPGLNRIPILGNAFKDTSKESTRRELLIFIQATVVLNPEDIDAASWREDIRTEIGAEAYSTFPNPNDLPTPETHPILNGQPAEPVEAAPVEPKKRWHPRSPRD